MPITRRTLEKWRKEALCDTNMQMEDREVSIEGTVSLDIHIWEELNQRILRLTQELIDQHLIKRKS